MEQIKRVVLSCIEEGITPFLWGSHGIGKSQIIKQIALDKGYDLIELRLGQMEPMDLIGLPEKKNGKTVWLQPAWFPKNGSKCIIFLDEINRGHPDVLQAIFQLVLDRRIYTHKLSDSVGIVCAGNYCDDNYQVSDLDPALMDRFLHINLVFDKHSWLDWAKKNKISNNIKGFVEDNHLKSSKNKSLSLTTTPRSLEVLNKIVNNKKIRKEDYSMICDGLLNKKDVAQMLYYVMGNKKQFDILKNFKSKEIQNIIDSRNMDLLHDLNTVLLVELSHMDDLTQQQLTNLSNYLGLLPKDITYAFMKKFALKSLLFDKLIRTPEFVNLRKRLTT